ncbi:TadE/TadG family type IV pilus assembly protein [Paenibacillus sophorae]|nr:TadE/TadG family type IV pilus assembly protein [Paenibacillus sophorae]
MSKNEGSMVVEAAMVLPVFLLFVLFLIFIVQMTLYSTALQSTVSDTVKEVATHMYPVALTAEKAEQARTTSGEAENGTDDQSASDNVGSEATGSGKTSVWTIPRLSVADWAEQYAAELPPPLDEWIRSAAKKGEGPLQELQAEGSEAVLDAAVKPLLKPYIASDMLDYRRIHVSNVIVPKLKDGEKPYFGLQVSYELPMKVPFLNWSIVLEASSVERLWIGDTGESGSGDQEGGEEDTSSIAILEKPNPARPNKQGVIRIKIAPNASANLTVFYKSGKSTAKYLGWKKADENGFIEWEWRIGGKTTPGSWPTFVIETEDGQSAEGQFFVADKPD